MPLHLSLAPAIFDSTVHGGGIRFKVGLTFRVRFGVRGYRLQGGFRVEGLGVTFDPK